MDEISLYFPYFHVRDDTWLKAAALYLPQVARVRPPDYPVNDSPTATILRDELDFLCDVAPGSQAATVAQEFLALVQQEERALLERYRIPQDPQGGGFMSEVNNPWYQDETRFAWIHTSQLGADAGPFDPLVRHLRDMGLAEIRRFDPLTGVRDDINWVGMHPHLVAVYSCALANRIAEANALTPVTHDPRLFALPSHWTIDELAAALLQDGRLPTSPVTGGHTATLYAYAAIAAVIPADIEHVPAEKIVQVRQTLSNEFEAFRAHVETLGEEFARLDGIEDSGILQARLNFMVERDLAKPMRELERGLQALGMQPVRAVFGMKSLELPVIAALAAQMANISPIVGAGGAIATQLVASAQSARRAAVEKRTSAAGYLLGLRRGLSPDGALTRVRRALSGPSSGTTV